MTWFASIIEEQDTRLPLICSGAAAAGSWFLGRPGSAPTVDARIAGYCEALEKRLGDREPIVCRIKSGRPKNKWKAALAKNPSRGIVCANDFTGSSLAEKRLPNWEWLYRPKMRLAGIDDVKVREPYIGSAHDTPSSPAPTWERFAVSTMLERLA